MDTARNHLETIPNLLERMATLMDIGDVNREKEIIIEEILTEMWRYIQTYSIRGLHDVSFLLALSPAIGTPFNLVTYVLQNVETTLPIWYVMDEFGSRIQHSDDPTFRTVPFYYTFTQVSYTLLFPIQNVKFRGSNVAVKARHHIESFQ